MEEVKDYPPYLDYPRKPKQMTNGDRIRAMSDEELEASIISVHLGYCPWCNRNCEYNGEHGCDTCISNWLKQPAEENAND